jgi:deoxyribodipyrimidine photo-lyase
MKNHARDKLDPAYNLPQIEAAETYDDFMDRYAEGTPDPRQDSWLLWGKKIIEWSPTYEEPLHAMIHMHDRYALDGRDPNSCANILWCFGLHDHPWPERPIFGKFRFMSLEGMKRKTDV